MSRSDLNMLQSVISLLHVFFSDIGLLVTTPMTRARTKDMSLSFFLHTLRALAVMSDSHSCVPRCRRTVQTIITSSQAHVSLPRGSSESGECRERCDVQTIEMSTTHRPNGCKATSTNSNANTIISGKVKGAAL